MDDWVQFAEPQHSLVIFGVRLVGANPHVAKQLLFTLVLVILVVALSRLLRALTRLLLGKRHGSRLGFWVRQFIHLFTAALLAVGLLSIWFTNPAHLATFLGLVSAGVAFALQRVITALAGYLVILRGHTFNVGDRITMGGVRGDVIALGFMQTTIMEMGQPPTIETEADPAMWVRARQYTGRIVTVTNDKIFQEPVYNYTRDFPYLWEEMHIPVTYDADRARAEAILLEAAQRHAIKTDGLGEDVIQAIERRFALRRADVVPRVYYRITDNWLELTVRFVTYDYAIREIKDAMSREILAAFQAAGIGIASSTHDIVGLPPLRVQLAPVEGEARSKESLPAE